MLEHRGLYLNAGCSAHCSCEKITGANEPCVVYGNCPKVGADISRKSTDMDSIRDDGPEFGIHIRADHKADNHQFAFVCGESKFLTDLCQESPWSYYCTTSGRVSQKPKSVREQMCIDDCSCVNLLGVVCSPVFLMGCKAVNEELPGPAADRRTLDEIEISEDGKVAVVDVDGIATEIELERRDDWTLNCLSLPLGDVFH